MRAAWPPWVVIALALAALVFGPGCKVGSRPPPPVAPIAASPSSPPLPPEMDCWPAPTVAGLWRPVPVERFAGIDATWTLNAVFERLGPARRELGSGLYIFDWEAEDGRVFVVSSSSRCGVVRQAGFAP
jgi:hypothetical protein